MAVGEWDQRQLCPDGGCIGVIGPDGTCKVCGHAAPNWGDERNRGLLDPPDDDDQDDDGRADDEDGDEGGDEGEGGDDDGDEDEDGGDEPDDDEPDDDGGGIQHAAGPPREWTVRELCSDGNCIGVIGPDGRCKVCGKPAPGEPAEVVATRDLPAVHAAGDEPADREHCPDASCAGLIGDDGRCAVCGKGAS